MDYRPQQSIKVYAYTEAEARTRAIARFENVVDPRVERVRPTHSRVGSPPAWAVLVSYQGTSIGKEGQ